MQANLPTYLDIPPKWMIYLSSRSTLGISHATHSHLVGLRKNWQGPKMVTSIGVKVEALTGGQLCHISIGRPPFPHYDWLSGVCFIPFPCFWRVINGWRYYQCHHLSIGCSLACWMAKFNHEGNHNRSFITLAFTFTTLHLLLYIWGPSMKSDAFATASLSPFSFDPHPCVCLYMFSLLSPLLLFFLFHYYTFYLAKGNPPTLQLYLDVIGLA